MTDQTTERVTLNCECGHHIDMHSKGKIGCESEDCSCLLSVSGVLAARVAEATAEAQREAFGIAAAVIYQLAPNTVLYVDEATLVRDDFTVERYDHDHDRRIGIKVHRNYRDDAPEVAVGHEFNWQTGYCSCGWAGPAIDEVPVAHAAHVRRYWDAARDLPPS